MTYRKENFWDPLVNTGTHEYSTRKCDKEYLNSLPTEKVDEFITEQHASNHRYLATHPEINLIIGLIFKQLYDKKPRNIKQYLAKFFLGINTHDLKQMLEKQLKQQRQIDLKDLNIPSFYKTPQCDCAIK